VQLTRLVVGPLDTNCWLLSDGTGGPLVIVDPADEPEVLLAAVDGREAAAIVLTHGHFDHLQAVAPVQDATGAPLMVGSADAYRLSGPGPSGGALFGFDHPQLHPDRLLEDGDTVEAGALRLIVMSTPGHTEGGICLFAEASDDDVPHLIAGDTVFAGSVGRSDFAGGDGRALRNSIASKIAGLPPDTRVHPGHGPDTTIGREVEINPFFPRA
jgi:hydroxyacylglutathione hydrolase